MGAPAAVVAMAALVAGALWMTLRFAAVTDLAVLPLHSRRHVTWWQLHAAVVYVACGVTAAGAGVVALLGS